MNLEHVHSGNSDLELAMKPITISRVGFAGQELGKRRVGVVFLVAMIVGAVVGEEVDVYRQLQVLLRLVRWPIRVEPCGADILYGAFAPDATRIEQGLFQQVRRQNELRNFRDAGRPTDCSAFLLKL